MGAPIESISLPQTVTEIGQDAFCGTKLRSIDLPDSVTTVGDSVFAACKELVSVKLSQNLRSLNYNMFNNCPNPKKLRALLSFYSNVAPYTSPVRMVQGNISLYPINRVV